MASKEHKAKYRIIKNISHSCLFTDRVCISDTVTGFALDSSFPMKKEVSVPENPGFCVADFAALSDERRLRSKTFLLFNMDKRSLRSKS